MRFDPEYGCPWHAADECNDPDCIRQVGGSVLAAELADAERWANGDGRERD